MSSVSFNIMENVDIECRKYAQSWTEFSEVIKIYSSRVHLAYPRPNKIVAMTHLCDYLCDNSHFLFLHRKVADVFEEKLIEFWKRDKWFGARIYLQKLFPMSAALSGEKVLPRPYNTRISGTERSKE